MHPRATLYVNHHCQDQAEEECYQARDEQKGPWPVEHHESHMPPAIGERVQLGVSPAGIVGNGNLSNPQAAGGGLDHHLRGELHSPGPEVQLIEGIPGYATQTAMGVGDSGREEPVQNPGQNRISYITMKGGHRPRDDPAFEPRSHDQVILAALQAGKHI